MLKKIAGSRFFLLLDYDGTIVPIVERPELAILQPDMKKLLGRLVRRFKVAIISGRSLADIKGLVGLKEVYYAGNHGLEISGPGIQLVVPEAERAQPAIFKICEKLEVNLKKIEGVMIENKGLTASVHYRSVRREEISRLNEIFEETVEPHLTTGTVKVTSGKKVLEIRPNLNWDKGKAILWIMDVIDPNKTLIPIYIGDDKTDEDAFLALKNRGITVLVSRKRKRSHAKFFLRNVDEVKAFLKKQV